MSSSGARRPDRQVIDADKLNKRVRVKFHGGREVVGVLKGFDPLVNLVLDEAVEYLRGACECGRLGGRACARG